MTLLAVQTGAWVAARPLARAAMEPWYERARLAYSARLVIALSFIPFVLYSAMFGLVLERELPIMHARAFEFAGMGGVIPALVVSSVLMSRKIRRRAIGFKPIVAGLVIGWLIHFSQATIAMILVIVNAGAFGWWTVAVMAGGLCLIVMLWKGGTLQILRSLQLARPAEPRLTKIAEQAAASLGMPAPPCYQLRWQSANALAFPMTGSIAFTDAAVDSLDDRQLYAVSLHELAHLAEPRSVLVLRGLSSLSLYCYVILILFAVRFGLSGMLVAMGLFLLGRIAISRLSRKWEKVADSVAGANQDQDLNYAHALLRIYEINMMPLVGIFRGGNHPHGYDRIVAAGLTPEFARPARPSRSSTFIGFALASLIGFVLYFSVAVATRIIVEHYHPGTPATQSE